MSEFKDFKSLIDWGVRECFDGLIREGSAGLRNALFTFASVYSTWQKEKAEEPAFAQFRRREASFKTFAKQQGLSLELAGERMTTRGGIALPTYFEDGTEFAWRAWANFKE